MLLWLPGFVTMAQNGYVMVSYDVSIPAGNTASYIRDVSFRGTGLEIGGFIRPRLSLGIGASWNTFATDKGRVTLATDNNTVVTGKQFRHYSTVPIYGMLRYYLQPNESGKFMPFVGAGAGTIYGNRETSMGILAVAAEGWQFGLFPEAGLAYRLRSDAGLFVQVRYNYGFKDDDLPATSYVGVNAGISFLF